MCSLASRITNSLEYDFSHKYNTITKNNIIKYRLLGENTSAGVRFQQPMTPEMSSDSRTSNYRSKFSAP